MAVGSGGQVGGGALLPSRLALLQGPCGRLRVQIDTRSGQAAPSSIAAEPALTKLQAGDQQQQQLQQQHQQPVEQQCEQQHEEQPQQLQAGGPSHSQPESQPSPQGQQHQTQPQVHVAVGTRAVHRTLLSMQTRMLWHMVEGLLDADARSSTARANNNFGYSLAHKVVSAMATCRGDPWLAALRPLVLEHAITRLLPSASIAPPPRLPAHASPVVQLLPTLASWLHHAYFRSQLRARLDEGVHGMQDASVHWVYCSHPLTSVLHFRSSRRPPLLLIIRETRLDVEGMFRRESSKWTSQGRQTFQRQEFEQLLHHLLEPLP
ncbi:hypothetical protein DUNSADRAFT_8834 [Dunaliella salina]|nr:hypothetical protein DUNSADRAFT_8834 [Dunaliella salina]|eukprot:KAF5834479.1 hypothetical protein DUNSADRAFT_8834 [Dunaliella salina]